MRKPLALLVLIISNTIANHAITNFIGVYPSLNYRHLHGMICAHTTCSLQEPTNPFASADDSQVHNPDLLKVKTTIPKAVSLVSKLACVCISVCVCMQAHVVLMEQGYQFALDCHQHIWIYQWIQAVTCHSIFKYKVARCSCWCYNMGKLCST